ncbi:unnamed protein product [Trichobilharzia regenti]|nr:unnamed protein product [Trichobilharzia regenti]
MELALKYFNECIELCLKHNLNSDKRLAVIYRNRSLVYLQTNEYQSAVNDCKLALSIEPNCPIAVYRKALALKDFGTLHSAVVNHFGKCFIMRVDNRLSLRPMYLLPQLHSN